MPSFFVVKEKDLVNNHCTQKFSKYALRKRGLLELAENFQPPPAQQSQDKERDL